MVDWFRRRKAGPSDDVGGPAHLEAETAKELVDRTPREPEPADGFSEAGIREALRDVRDPEIGRDLISLNMIRSIDIAGSHVTVGVSLTTAGCPLKHRITSDITERLKLIEGIQEVEVDFGVMTDEDRQNLLTSFTAVPRRSPQPFGTNQGPASSPW